MSEEPPARTAVSRKALQAFLDIRAERRTMSPALTSPRSMSYSKLLQETPDTFRQLHTLRKALETAPKPQLKKVGSLAGIQGIKSVIGGQRSTTFRKLSEKRLPPKILSNPRTLDKGFNCSFDIEETEESDPYVMDISPEKYLREVRDGVRSQLTLPRAEIVIETWHGPESC